MYFCDLLVDVFKLSVRSLDSRKKCDGMLLYSRETAILIAKFDWMTPTENQKKLKFLSVKL